MNLWKQDMWEKRGISHIASDVKKNFFKWMKSDTYNEML